MKALILAYDFPPYVSVGGLRPYSWYKYFKEFGLEPIVVTRQWDNKYGNSLDYIAASESKKIIIEETEKGIIIRTPYFPNLANKILLKYGEKNFRFFRKTISAFYEFTQWLFFVGPKVQLYFAAKNYLKNNKVDVIIATGEPFILFRYASLLSKKFNVPWIADYRDPWSQDISIYNKRFLKLFHLYHEKKIVRTASEITTASEYFKQKISELLLGKKSSLISNGFDHDNACYGIPVKDKCKLNIAFVGTIYDWHPIETVLDVIYIINQNQQKVHVNFYGINDSSILDDILCRKPELNSYVTIYSRMENKRLLKELAMNQCLLLFNYYVFMGTKIYDYIAVNRPILFCFTDEPEANELRNLHYGFNDKLSDNVSPQIFILQSVKNSYVLKDKKELNKVLIDLCNNLEKYNKPNQYLAEETMRFSRKEQAHEMTTLIEKRLNNET